MYSPRIGLLIASFLVGSAAIGSAQEPAKSVSPSAHLLPPVEICPSSTGFDFSKVPPAPRNPARFGMFAVPPSGPGYYSGLDCLTGRFLETPPKDNFARFGLSGMSYFDYDWRFLDDPSYVPTILDSWKRIRVGNDWLVSTGGEVKYRYHNEYNSRLTEFNNDYSLIRVRAYVDAWYRDWFRIYAEGIYADTSTQSIPPQSSDINRGDFQNLFIEGKIGNWMDHPSYARVGRQEIALGSQRLVGTPEWGNARRTFDGVRAYRVGEQWDVDLFWLQPVVADANYRYGADHNQNFAGSWVTYRPRKGTFLDMYYLVYENANHVTQTAIIRDPATIHTIGGRYAGDIDNRWLWDSEGAIQLGQVNNAPVFAGMYSGGVGYHFRDVPADPTFWITYNYCSGDHSPNKGDYNTFTQLYPYIHYYMGWVDAIGRQNTHELNLRCYLYPNNWTMILLQYHHFWLDSATDALYNIAGNAYRRDPTGRAGVDVGQKVDVLVNFHLTRTSDFYVGYSYLWGGDFLKGTAGPNAAVNGSVCYVGYRFRW